MNEPKRYRKKPVVIEAILWTGSNKAAVTHFMVGDSGGFVTFGESFLGENNYIEIPTLEGTLRANAGDWIIKGLRGEFYPCKPDIFEATYYEVAE